MFQQKKNTKKSLINVWIVEDHQQIRETIADVLSLDTSLICPVAVGSAEEMLQQLKSNHKLPDILLLDLVLPGLSGIQSIPLIKKIAPTCKILIFTLLEDERKTMDAIRAGADGYLLKDENINRIPEFIKQTMQGGAPLSSPVSKHLLNHHMEAQNTTSTSPKPPLTYGLSEQEISILRLASHGMVKKDISEALSINYHKIDYHMRRIFKKLDVRNIQGAVGKAVREHIIEESS